MAHPTERRSQLYAYDEGGDAWDPFVNNADGILLASAARTGDTYTEDKYNYNGDGLVLFVNVSVDPASASITPNIQIKDPASGNYFTAWTAAVAITAVGLYAYLFCPGGATGSYTEAVNLRFSRIGRIFMDHADSDSITYSVGVTVLV